MHRRQPMGSPRIDPCIGPRTDPCIDISQWSLHGSTRAPMARASTLARGLSTDRPMHRWPIHRRQPLVSPWIDPCTDVSSWSLHGSTRAPTAHASMSSRGLSTDRPVHRRHPVVSPRIDPCIGPWIDLCIGPRIDPCTNGPCIDVISWSLHGQTRAPTSSRGLSTDRPVHRTMDRPVHRPTDRLVHRPTDRPHTPTTRAPLARGLSAD